MKLNSISINLVYCTENVTTIIYKDSPGDTYFSTDSRHGLPLIADIDFHNECRLLFKFFGL
jgi:hypothetical protein